MLSLTSGLFFLTFLYLQFGSSAFLIYFMIGTLIGVPCALLFKEVAEGSIDNTAPKTLRHNIRSRIFDYLNGLGPIERMLIELSLPLIIFLIAIYIAVAWVPLTAEFIGVFIYLTSAKVIVRIKKWYYKRKLKKNLLNLRTILSEEEKNKPEMRDLLEKIRLILKEDKL